MFDERIVEKLSVIKRNNLLLFIVLSLLFIFIKIIINQSYDFINYLAEVYFLVLSLLTFVIIFIYEVNEEIVDERVIKNSYHIYRVMFSVIIYGGIGIYFTQAFISIYRGIANPIPNNFFISWLIFVSLLTSFISAKIQKIYFNYKIIEFNKSKYYKNIFQRICQSLFICLLYIFYILVIAFAVNAYQIGIIVIIAIFISFISFALQYFIFSIYEKNHYDEAIFYESGKVRYLSKNVLLFLVIGLFYSILLSVSSSILNIYHFKIIEEQDASPIFRKLYEFSIMGQYINIDNLVIILLCSIFIYLSLRKYIKNDSKLNLYLFVTIIVFLYDLFWFMFSIFATRINHEDILKIFVFRSQLEIGVFFLSAIWKFLIYFYIKSKKFPYSHLFLIYIILHISIYILMKFLFTQINSVKYRLLYLNNINSIAFLGLAIFYIIIISKISNSFISIDEKKEPLIFET